MASLLAGIQSPQPVDWGRSFSAGRDAIFDEQRQARADQRDKNLLIAQYAADADTPEKWSQAMGDLQRAGVPDAHQFASRFDLRDTLIQRAYSAADQMNSRTAGQFLSSLGQVGTPDGVTLSGGYLSSLGAAPPVGSVETKPLGASLAKSESGGNPSVVNSLGFSGKYQMGEGALADAGVYTDPTPGKRNDWAGQFNIPGFPEVRTQADFLKNEAAQDAAFNSHEGRLERDMKAAGLDRFIGQQIAGVPITAEGLVWMAHLGGVGGTRKFLETSGRYNPADANGTRLSDYARRGAGGGGQVRPATRDVQPPAPNGVPMEALGVLAQNPTYAGTAISAAINQYATPKDTTVWARLDDGRLFNQRTGEIVTAPGVTDIKPTDDIREYEFAKTQGFSGSFQDWQLQNKRAGAMSLYPNESPESIGDKKYQETMGAKEAETYNNILEGGRTALVTMGDLNSLEAGLQQVPTGGFEPLKAQFANYAASLGLDVQDAQQLGGSQAIQAIVARIAPRLRVPGAGTTSDKDLALFMASLPTLANSPEGNRLIIQTLRAFSQRAVQEAQIVNDGNAAGLPRSQIRKNLLALGPVITDEQAKTIFRPGQGAPQGLPQFDPRAAPAPAQAAPQAGPPRISSDEEYNALPSNTDFIAPDGTIRRKP
jgi:hypothetical protein